jgi:hypothetical protein
MTATGEFQCPPVGRNRWPLTHVEPDLARCGGRMPIIREPCGSDAPLASPLTR